MEFLQKLRDTFDNLVKIIFVSENQLEAKCVRPSDVYNVDKDKEFTGVVTFRNDWLGLINDNVKFDPTCFKDICSGSKVRGIAHKEYTQWKVISLEIDMVATINKEHNSVNTTDESNLDATILNDSDYFQNLEHFLGIVDHFSDGVLYSGNWAFLTGSCKLNYPPAKGDCVMIWSLFEHQNDEKILAERIEYQRTKAFRVSLTSKTDNSYIFDDKILCPKILCRDVPVSVEKYFVVAVESDCALDCNWRAVSVALDYGSSYAKPFEFLPTKTDSAELYENPHLPRVPDPSACGETSAGDVNIEMIDRIELDHLYNTRIFSLTVKCDSESPIVVNGIWVRTANKLTQVAVDTSCAADGAVLFPVTIGRRGRHTFTMSCTAKLIGASVEKVVVGLDHLSIVQDVNVMVGSVEEKETNPERLFGIKGGKPYRTRRFLSNVLPKADIPHRVLEAVLTGDLEHLMPILNEPLRESNYVEKVRIFLFLEEIQRRHVFSSYTLYKIKLKTEGKLFVIDVIKTEDRCPFASGDRVNIFPLKHTDDVCSSTYYQGFINTIDGSKLSMSFDDVAFSMMKNDDYCRVEFNPSRVPFRKAHMGLNLVEDTFSIHNLFPTSLPPCVPPQASYVEEGFAIVRNPLQDPLDDDVPTFEWINPNLNVEQKNAVRSILVGCCRPLPYIIFGPPGTGKTITLVEAICQTFLLVKHSRILVVAPSNPATDLIAERLLDTGVFNNLQLARFNGYHRSQMILPESIREICWDVDETDDVLDCRVILTTPITAATLYENKVSCDHFTHVFIDEAGQMTEDQTCIALSFINERDGGQVVMAGDPKQLGPVITSRLAGQYGYDVSTFTRLCNSLLYSPDYAQILSTRNAENIDISSADCAVAKDAIDTSAMYDSRLITLLVRNYRSSQPLVHLPSLLFYHNSLIAPETREEDQLYLSWKALPNKKFPLLFYGMRGICNTCKSGSRENAMEAVVITEFVESLLELGVEPEDIGIITPYRNQVKRIIKTLAKRNAHNVDVGSVEKFQGQERPVIILSTVRSYSAKASINSAYDIGFVSSPERFNVAITRAKSLLIIVGDPTVLELSYHWRALISYCNDNGAMVDTRGQQPVGKDMKN